MAKNWRIYIVAPTALNTAQNRTDLADLIAAAYGTDAETEKAALNNAAKIALVSAPTVTIARAVCLLADNALALAIQTWLDDLNDPLPAAQKAQWYAVANVAGLTYQSVMYGYRTLVASSRGNAYVTALIGQPFRNTHILADLSQVVPVQWAEEPE